jgi:PadR family transcriptional regulator PadR
MLIVRNVEHDGRIRKYYHITNIGLKRLEDFKMEWKELMTIYNYVAKEDGENE